MQNRPPPPAMPQGPMSASGASSSSVPMGALLLANLTMEQKEEVLSAAATLYSKEDAQPELYLRCRHSSWNPNKDCPTCLDYAMVRLVQAKDQKDFERSQRRLVEYCDQKQKEESAKAEGSPQAKPLVSPVPAGSAQLHPSVPGRKMMAGRVSW